MRNQSIHPRSAFSLIAILMTASTLAWGGMAEGKKAYDGGDFTTALQELQPLAKNGDKDAQKIIGDMFANGQGVRKDDATAANGYLKAAIGNHMEAQLRLSDMYSKGNGVQKDDAIAAYWQWKASVAFESLEMKKLETEVKKAHSTASKNRRPCSAPTYPPKAIRHHQQGTVSLVFLVDIDGKIIEASIAKSSGWPLLDVAARDALLLCSHQPSIVDGQTVQKVVRIDYKWALD